MPKEVRITRGLESMGALRSDGSGSVLKGKRKGDLLTAIKILPVTISPRSQANDQFQAAAEQLKRINLDPNPNLVKILYYGISELGSHPFIETEFVEGPDLQELLQPPYDAVFTLFEVLKVADHLANALAQAHRVGVIHGNIKNTNVKFDMDSADYVLVGFGLSTLTAKQLQSLKPEDSPFLAPEQRAGKYLFQSDIYSYGMILYHLLTGGAPFLRFESTDAGSSSRAALTVLLDTRKENMPDSWTADQKQQEQKVPEWLLDIIARCLQVNPLERYASGEELQSALVEHSVTEAGGAVVPALLQQENDRLRSLVIHNKEITADKEEEVARLKAIITHREEQLNALKYQMGTILPEKSGVGLSKVIMAVLLVGSLGAAGTYFFLNQQASDRSLIAYSEPAPETPAVGSDSNISENVLPASARDFKADPPGKVNNDIIVPKAEKETEEPVKKPEKKKEERKTAIKPKPERRTEPRRQRKVQAPVEEEQFYEPEPVPYRAKYTLNSSQAFFYSRPEESARRNLKLVLSDNTELVAVEDSNGFIYVSFFDTEGKSVRGWLRKQDLRRLN